MLRVRFVAAPGLALGYSVERLRDGLLYDFGSDVRAFVADPKRSVELIGEGSPYLAGLYRATLDLTAETAPDGCYAVYIHDAIHVGKIPGRVIGATQVTLRGGDDEPVSTSSSGGGIEIRFVGAGSS